jgi:hypothetical protein
VAEQLPHSDLTLACCRELRPVVGHLGVVVDQPTRGSGCQRKRGNAFRGREHGDERAALPRRPRVYVAQSTPEVNDLAAVSEHRDSGSDLAAAGQVAAKRVGHFAVALINVTADEFGRDLDFLSHVSANTSCAADLGVIRAAKRQPACARPTSGRAGVGNPR